MSAAAQARRVKDDAELAALAGTSGGYIIDPFNRRWHTTGCRSIGRMTTGETKWYAPTVKAAQAYFEQRSARSPTALPVVACPSCRPGADAQSPTTTCSSAVTGPTTSSGSLAEQQTERSDSRPRIGRRSTRHEFADELEGHAGVYLWCSEYIKYPPRREDLDAVARELRARLRELRAGDHQLLHAIYAGPKGPTTDVENNLLYNVHTGRDALAGAANGVVFEWWPDPPASVMRGYGCRYAYRLVSDGGGFQHWRSGRRLARWSTVSLGPLTGDKKLEAAWYALCTSPLVEPLGPSREPGEYFGLALELRVPSHPTPPNATFVKSLLDAIVCALQHEPDRRVALEMAPGVDAMLRRAGIVCDVADLADLLAGDERSVLGPRRGLRASTNWQPQDEDCVAVELRFGPSPDSDYRITGTAFTVARATEH